VPAAGGARRSCVAALLVASALWFLPSPAPAAELAPECGPPPSPTSVTVGVVDCFKILSDYLGGEVPVGYYVPPACDPALGRDCPVLYYTHGTGGSYREGVGAKGSAGNAWVKALTQGPPVDPRSTPDPWTYADTNTWVDQPDLDLIIVSPHGRTLPGGRGPAPDLDTGWFDWNPRYAEGGDNPQYATPPPQSSSFLSEELVPFVDRTFPTSGKRNQRAILGYSQGGFGSYINGLTHPDLWSSMGMRSGGALPLLAPGDIADDSAVVTGVAPPTAVPFTQIPGLVITAAPDALFAQIPGLVITAAPDALFAQNIVSEATVGFGDPVADQAWWRASNPTDLIPNARARAADGTQSVHLKHFVNDSVARRPDDYAVITSNYMSHVYESLLFPMNLYMERVFDRYEVERTFHHGPGNHSAPYGLPYFREQVAEQYANLRHWDGGGTPRPDPVRFDYRTLRTQFTIWDWEVSVARGPVEFLNLTDVSCESVTLRGTGTVTMTVPKKCHTGVQGNRTFVVDLGSSQATSEPAGLGTSRAYGRTVTVSLSPLHGRPSMDP
jgi:S-formylglutathione hydrolase FrmB